MTGWRAMRQASQRGSTGPGRAAEPSHDAGVDRPGLIRPANADFLTRGRFEGVGEGENRPGHSTARKIEE
jgi:hypothetical protein